jgi:hypothetical protein
MEEMNSRFIGIRSHHGFENLVGIFRLRRLGHKRRFPRHPHKFTPTCGNLTGQHRKPQRRQPDRLDQFVFVFSRSDQPKYKVQTLVIAFEPSQQHSNEVGDRLDQFLAIAHA